MANPEHLKILKQGVKVWNEWREENRGERPELSGADLTIANLREAYLWGANLSGARLGGADLSEANLTKANFDETVLFKAMLYKANLTMASLTFVDLFGANLPEANLTKAWLSRCSFTATHLFGTNFYKTKFYFNSFSYCDLSEAMNLSTVIHKGPSSIGIETIFESKGKIPVSFLKGCGVPKEVIETILPLAKGWPVQFYTCFISYSKKDQFFAERLKNDLEAKNIRCWFFPDDAVWGKDVYKNIDEAIRTYDKLVVICSINSLNSEPVLREIERGLQKEKATKEKHKETKRVLFPITKDDYLFKRWDHYLKPDLLRITIGDFRDWNDPAKYKDALYKLLKGLQK